MYTQHIGASLLALTLCIGIANAAHASGTQNVYMSQQYFNIPDSDLQKDVVAGKQLLIDTCLKHVNQGGNGGENFITFQWTAQGSNLASIQILDVHGYCVVRQ